MGRGAGFGLALIVIFALATAAAAQPVVVLVADRDNTLFEPIDGGDRSSGAGPDLYLKGPGAQVPYAELRRFVLRFDVEGGVPEGSTIVSATLTLNLNKSNYILPDDSLSATVHRVTSDWGEGSSSASDGNGAAPTTDDATWHHTFYPGEGSPGELWSSPGGDYVETPSATLALGNDSGPYTAESTPALVSDIQGWLDSGENFGWLLTTDVIDAGLRFASRESSFAEERPMLTLTLPEPGGAGLAAAALAVIAALARIRCR